MHVKKGDLVKVVAGKDRKLGPAKVLAVFPREGRVVVEGRNLVKKHVKGAPGTGRESGIVEVEAPIAASNVRLWSEKLSQPVRTQARWVGADGSLHTSESAAASTFNVAQERIRKVRFSVKSQEIFD
jgi:large subunit ribosomal protein L24